MYLISVKMPSIKKKKEKEERKNFKPSERHTSLL